MKTLRNEWKERLKKKYLITLTSCMGLFAFTTFPLSFLFGTLTFSVLLPLTSFQFHKNKNK
jgi:hypothetical protein